MGLQMSAEEEKSEWQNDWMADSLGYLGGMAGMAGRTIRKE